MRRSFLGRAIPAAFTTVGVAVPSVTAALVMLHAMVSGTTAQSSLPASPTATSVPATAPSRAQPTATATPRPTAVIPRTIAGPVVNDQYGQVQATLTVTGTRITNVSVSAPEDSPRSAAINQQAVPLLQSETLQAQSANVDVISGATITSDAYIQSLQGALQTASL